MLVSIFPIIWIWAGTYSLNECQISLSYSLKQQLISRNCALKAKQHKTPDLTFEDPYKSPESKKRQIAAACSLPFLPQPASLPVLPEQDQAGNAMDPTILPCRPLTSWTASGRTALTIKPLPTGWECSRLEKLCLIQNPNEYLETGGFPIVCALNGGGVC